MVRLTIYGRAAPKGSRTTGRRGDGTVYSRPAVKGEHAWTETVAQQARWTAAQVTVPDAPYRVTVAFYMARPKRPAHDHPTRGDLDKLVRAVLDGLVTGGLLSDDRHVVELHADKTWAVTPGGECCQVTIESAA